MALPAGLRRSEAGESVTSHESAGPDSCECIGGGLAKLAPKKGAGLSAVLSDFHKFDSKKEVASVLELHGNAPNAPPKKGHR